MADQTPPAEVSKYLAGIGAKGGKSKSAKKNAQFAAAQAKGRKTMTPKRLAHLAKARAARQAKAKKTD
jgi:hypothetical protein